MLKFLIFTLIIAVPPLVSGSALTNRTQPRGKHKHKELRTDYPFDLSFQHFTHNTKIVAPYWSYQYGWKVHEIPLSHLIVQGAFVNVSEFAPENHMKRTFVLEPKHLQKWEEKYGEFPNNSILLIDFGWAVTNNATFYEMSDVPLPISFPSISEKAAEWIVDSEKFVGVGVDTPTVDKETATGAPALHEFHHNGLYTIHKMALANLRYRIRDFYVIAFPLQSEAEEEALARVAAV